MPTPESQGWLTTLIGGLGAALAALGTWAWKHTHERLDVVDKKYDSKANKEDVERHRDYIARLFEKIEELGNKTEVRFAAVERQNHERHVELLNAIHAIPKKK